jgi:hypothetical protein
MGDAVASVQAVKQYCYVVVTAHTGLGGVSVGSHVIASSGRPDGQTLEELLRAGWQPVRERPMGGAGEAAVAYSLVLLERD